MNSKVSDLSGLSQLSADDLFLVANAGIIDGDIRYESRKVSYADLYSSVSTDLSAAGFGGKATVVEWTNV